MRRLVMGPERYSEVLASVGLQSSDIRAAPQSDTERRLWTALKRACDPDFVVNLPAGATLGGIGSAGNHEPPQEKP